MRSGGSDALRDGRRWQREVQYIIQRYITVSCSVHLVLASHVCVSNSQSAEKKQDGCSTAGT